MTQAYENYEKAIAEINDLLSCFDVLNKDKTNQAPRVMKRAALIMILTAWETYIEDVTDELLKKRLSLLNDIQLGKFVEKSFRKAHKQLNTPNAQNTKQLFEDFLGVDVTEKWKWNNFDHAKVCETLNTWTKRRGDAVHRISVDHNVPEVVRRPELNKCIKFFKALVDETESALAQA